MTFELILFDCDGVLVDSETIAAQVFIDLAREHGIHLNLADLLEHFVGRALIENIRHIEREHATALPPDFADRFRAQSLQALAENVRPMPGIRALIERLTLPYAVASSGRPIKIRTTLGATGLLPYFGDRLFSAAQVAAPKPAPDVFLYAAAQMGVAPAHCLVIEDSPSGIQAARAAGMTAYGLAAYTSAATLLAHGADRTFPNHAALLCHLIDLNMAQ